MTDKEGVKIFEGDIVRHENSTAVVEFEEVEFIAMCKDESHTAYDCPGNLILLSGKHSVVIGSIHDYLLKGNNYAN